jgi:hypothetical protein
MAGFDVVRQAMARAEAAKRDQEAEKTSGDNAMKARLEQARAQAQAVGSSFKPMQAEALPQASTDPRFAQMRNQVAQRMGAQAQQGQDALKRRFAAAGMMNSGASIKTMENAQQAASQQREEALQGVDAAETADLRQQQQAAQGRNFQREMTNAESDFKAKVFGAESAKGFVGLDMALEEFKINRDATRKNFDLAKKQADSTGGLFGGGGFLGLGI